MKVTSRRWSWLGAILAMVLLMIVVVACTAGPGGPSTPVGRPAAPDTGGTVPQPGKPPPADNQQMVKELAPIESVDLRVAESAPPQYFVDVKYGLPNGCIRPGGYEVERQGNTVRIRVSVLRPADPNVVCTMIYGLSTYNVPLGSDFVSGQTYTLDANGTTKTFTAQ